MIPHFAFFATDGILCEKCEMWYHYQCAMLTDDDRKRFETMNDPYYCMSCTLDMQCSDPVDSSIFSFDTRNAHETDPISNGISTRVDSDPSLVERTISDETGLKQIHTVENVKQPLKNKAKQVHSSSKHNASMDQRSRSNTPVHTVVTPQPLDSRSDPQHRALLNHTDNSKDLEQPVDTGQSVESITSANSPPIRVGEPMAPKNTQRLTNKQTNKKGDKQKLKTSEQEEQLKLARSMISNLERKINDLENSNRILRREVLSTNDNNTRDENIQPSVPQTGSSFINQVPYVPLNPTSEQEFRNLRDNLRNVELEQLKLRIQNMELSLLHQRVFSGMSYSGGLPQYNPYANHLGTNNVGYPHPHISPPTQNPAPHPYTVYRPIPQMVQLRQPMGFTHFGAYDAVPIHPMLNVHHFPVLPSSSPFFAPPQRILGMGVNGLPIHTHQGIGSLHGQNLQNGNLNGHGVQPVVNQNVVNPHYVGAHQASGNQTMRNHSRHTNVQLDVAAQTAEHRSPTRQSQPNDLSSAEQLPQSSMQGRACDNAVSNRPRQESDRVAAVPEDHRNSNLEQHCMGQSHGRESAILYDRQLKKIETELPGYTTDKDTPIVIEEDPDMSLGNGETSSLKIGMVGDVTRTVEYRQDAKKPFLASGRASEKTGKRRSL